MSVEQLPHNNLMSEGISQKDRIIKSVMAALYAELSADKPLLLKDGTECKIVAFHEPKDMENGLTYGFDVKLPDGHALSHLELSVHCAGWGRNLA